MEMAVLKLLMAGMDLAEVGATDIRTVNGSWNDNTSLLSRIMVAGGGGGSDNTTNEAIGAGDDGSGGAGGGLVAENARVNGVYSLGTGATQTIGTLGKGQDATYDADTGGAGSGYRRRICN